MSGYVQDDYLVTCQRSGQKALRSQCVKQWNGIIVLRKYAEVRHPLDTPVIPRAEPVVKDATGKEDEDSNQLAYGDVTADDL